MHLRNSWYVGCWSRELEAKPVAATILGDPVVLYRTAGGTVAALERPLPAPAGSAQHGTSRRRLIQCGYHGMQMDVTGRCVGVPGQKAVPPRAKVRSCPVVERYGSA